MLVVTLFDAFNADATHVQTHQIICVQLCCNHLSPYLKYELLDLVSFTARQLFREEEVDSDT